MIFQFFNFTYYLSSLLHTNPSSFFTQLFCEKVIPNSGGRAFLLRQYLLSRELELCRLEKSQADGQNNRKVFHCQFFRLKSHECLLYDTPFALNTYTLNKRIIRKNKKPLSFSYGKWLGILGALLPLKTVFHFPTLVLSRSGC